MNHSYFVLSVLVSVTSCLANKGVLSGMQAAAGSQSQNLQPLLLGLTAVVGFLLIVFALLIIHRLLRKNREDGEKWGYVNSAEEMDEDQTKM